MASLVCAIDEPDLIAKFSRSAVDLHNLDLLFVGSDPLSVKVHVAEATVCGLCIQPMPVDRMLRLRHAVYGSRDDGANFRSVIAVERPDPAFVHYVLGYGIDDVFDTSVPDAEFAAQLATFAEGRLRACADQLVAGVDPRSRWWTASLTMPMRWIARQNQPPDVALGNPQSYAVGGALHVRVDQPRHRCSAVVHCAHCVNY